MLYLFLLYIYNDAKIDGQPGGKIMVSLRNSVSYSVAVTFRRVDVCPTTGAGRKNSRGKI